MAERPSIVFGAGVEEPPIIAGQSIGGITGGNGELLTETVVIPSRIADPQPVAGIAIRIPFGGGSQKNCDQLIRLSERQIAWEQAQQLFELGVISEDEMKEIGRRFYEVMLKD